MIAGRLVGLVWLASCGFQVPAEPTGDAPKLGDPDAKVPTDAKRFEDAPPATGSLSVAVTPLTAMDINLSAEGTIDWAHWGLIDEASFDHKSGGGSISDLTMTPEISFTGSPVTTSWNNGTPHNVVVGTSSGVAVNQGASMQFTASAGTSLRVLRLYVGVQNASARLDVSLSDSSAPAQTKTLSDMNGDTGVAYTVTYQAGSADQKLVVSWAATAEFGDPTFALAALLGATLH